jgi:hypothetical protein
VHDTLNQGNCQESWRVDDHATNPFGACSACPEKVLIVFGKENRVTVALGAERNSIARRDRSHW